MARNRRWWPGIPALQLGLICVVLLAAGCRDQHTGVEAMKTSVPRQDSGNHIRNPQLSLNDGVRRERGAATLPRLKSKHDLETYVNKVVVVQGLAVNRKGFAEVTCGFYTFEIPELPSWPLGFSGKRVSVTGILKRRTINVAPTPPRAPGSATQHGQERRLGLGPGPALPEYILTSVEWETEPA